MVKGGLSGSGSRGRERSGRGGRSGRLPVQSTLPSLRYGRYTAGKAPASLYLVWGRAERSTVT